MPDENGTPDRRAPRAEPAAPAAVPRTLYAEFTARPGTESAVQDLIVAYADEVRAEPGNLRFEVYRRAESPAAFVVFERYADEAAFRAHLAHPAGRAFNDELVLLIEEDASVLSFLNDVVS